MNVTTKLMCKHSELLTLRSLLSHNIPTAEKVRYGKRLTSAWRSHFCTFLCLWMSPGCLLLSPSVCTNIQQVRLRAVTQNETSNTSDRRPRLGSSPRTRIVSSRGFSNVAQRNMNHPLPPRLPGRRRKDRFCFSRR